MSAGAQANRSYALTLALTPMAARQARREVRDQLSSWQLTDKLDVVDLVVTELVTNALKHGEPRDSLTLEVAADEQRIRISVIDGSAVRPVARQVEADETSGRGMRIVEALAERWGTEDCDGGKQVWVELHLAGPLG